MMQVMPWQRAMMCAQVGNLQASKFGNCKKKDAGDAVAKGHDMPAGWQPAVRASKPRTCWNDAGDAVAKGHDMPAGWQPAGVKASDLLQ